MELTLQQQIFQNLTKAGKVLIALPENAQPDLVASALALKMFLQKLEKPSDVVTTAFLPENLTFLPGFADIKREMNGAKNLVVVLNTTATQLDELSYEEQPGAVTIFLKPKSGSFTPKDVSFREEGAAHDTIVVLGARSLEDLGQLFEQSSEIFFASPKINIDIHPGNEYFGAINLVDINATSVAEILSGLFASFEQQLVDEDIATCLLTGIIYKTNSFQHVQTTPQSFLKASELISLGGRQQEIIKNLFKTKSLPLLRLWGRALARLKIEDEHSTIYSMLNLSDFGKSGAHSEDLQAVLKELLENVSGYKVVALIAEMLGGGVKVLFALHNSIDIDGFFTHLEVEAPEPYSLPIGPYRVYDLELPAMPLADAETKFLEAIKKLPVPTDQ